MSSMASVLPTVNKVLSCFNNNHNLHAVTHIAKQHLEQVHLRHLKYLLGINRRAVNATAWGETGSYPIIVEMLKLNVKYFKKIMNLPSSQLVKAAMTEQVSPKESPLDGIPTGRNPHQISCSGDSVPWCPESPLDGIPTARLTSRLHVL